MISVSQHCKERYAERFKDKSDKTDIASYVAMNSDRIESAISKIIKYGKLVYTGKLRRDKKMTSVYVSDVWILLVDTDSNTAITIYRVDLGLGDDFDRQFINGHLNHINELSIDLESSIGEIDSEISTYKNMVEDLKDELSEYKSKTKNLETIISSYNEYIIGLEAKKSIADDKIKDIVNKIIGKPRF